MSYRMEGQELREQLRWLIKLRWIGIIGVFVAVHVIREVAFLSFSLIPVYAILGFAALYNTYFSWALKFPQREARKLAVSQIFLDQLTDVVARYGGEEFAIIMFEITKNEAVKVAERLRHLVEWLKLPNEKGQPGGKVTVSIGVSAYPDDADSLEKLLDEADAALYRAKHEGRNRVEAAGVYAQ